MRTVSWNGSTTSRWRKTRTQGSRQSLSDWWGGAGSPLELLRRIQRTDCTARQIIREYGILPPEHEPSNGQVERAAETGYFLSAHSTSSYGNLKAWDKVKQTSKEKWREWARLMLEATLNGTEETF